MTLATIAAVAIATVAFTYPAAAPTLKRENSGVISRDGAPPPEYLADMGGWVVNADWSDLQTTPGGSLSKIGTDWIDYNIGQVRRVNAAHPTYKLRLKLRLFAGVRAPEWAKTLDGPPIRVTDPGSGVTGTVGRFWRQRFGTAYADFIGKIAARYDSVDVISDVTLNRCTTVYAEPYIRQINDPGSVANLVQAGFTTDADTSCHQQEIITGRAFATTHVSVAFNPYQQINVDINGKITTETNEALTEKMIGYCRQQLGRQCVLENNSIRTPELGGDYTAMYAKIKAMGPPIAFQTATLARVGDLGATLQWAVEQGANVVEWPGGGLTPDEVGHFNAELKANPPQ